MLTVVPAVRRGEIEDSALFRNVANIGSTRYNGCMSDAERDYLTAAEAAALLGLPGRTVRYRLERGIMRGVAVNPRLWLVPRAEVERWREVGHLRKRRKPRSES